MSTLFDTILSYIRKYKNEPNSMATIETREVCDQRRRGTITMKWWKEKGILFITHIQLESVPLAPKHILTNCMKALRNVEDLGVNSVKLVAVANSELIGKLREHDWHAEDAGVLSYSM